MNLMAVIAWGMLSEFETRKEGRYALRNEVCTHRDTHSSRQSERKRGKYVKRLGIIALLSTLGVVAAASGASAATNFDNAPSGAHYRQSSVEPVCTSTTVPTTGAITVSCTGTQIAGVGNTNADLLLSVTGTANFVCHNPGNDNIVEPHSASVDEATSATLVPSRNGTLVVPDQSVTISPEDAAAQFECPNANWREEFTGFSLLSFTYSLTFAGFTDPAILITG